MLCKGEKTAKPSFEDELLNLDEQELSMKKRGKAQLSVNAQKLELNLVQLLSVLAAKLQTRPAPGAHII